MRILVLASHRRAGGAQLVANDLADSLAANGHCVRLRYLYEVRDQPRPPGGDALIEAGSPVRLWDYVKVVWRLHEEIGAFRPDAMISHMPLACVVGQSVAALWKIKARIAVQHIPPTACKRVMRLLDGVCGATGVYTTNVAVSRSVLKAFSGWGKAYRARQIVIPNGVKFESLRTREETREEFRLPLDEPLITFCGRLTEQKNPEQLVFMMAEVGGHLVLVGDGDLADETHCLAKQLGVSARVHFLGHLDRRVAWRVMAASDVFVLPSKYEGMSLALLEALHAGLPIVASAIEANQEVLTDQTGEEYGVLLEGDDRLSWSGAVGRILQDDQLRERLARKAAARAGVYTLDAMTRAYEAVLTDDLQKDQGARSGRWPLTACRRRARDR